MVRRLPQEPGVYLIYDHEGRPWYVGKSMQLRRRLKEHLKDLRDFGASGPALDAILAQKLRWAKIANDGSAKGDVLSGERGKSGTGTPLSKGKGQEGLIAIAEECLIRKLRTYRCGNFTSNEIYFPAEPDGTRRSAHPRGEIRETARPTECKAMGSKLF